MRGIAYAFGALAAVTAGLIALADLFSADSATEAAIAGGVMVLVPIALLTWAALSRLSVAQQITSGLLLVTTAVAGFGWVLELRFGTRDSDWTLTRLALVVLAVSAVAAVLRPRSHPRTTADAAGTAQTLATNEATGTPRSTGSRSAAGVERTTEAEVTTGPEQTAGTDEAATATQGSTERDRITATTGTAEREQATATAGGGGTGETTDAEGTAATSAGSGAGRRAEGSLLELVRAVCGNGPWVGALVAGAVPAFGVLAALLSAISRGVEAARPLLAVPLGSTVSWPGAGPSGSAAGEPGVDSLVALVIVVGAYAVLVPRRVHADLALSAFAAVALLIPAAFGLLWWTGAVAGTLVGAVALVRAAGSRTLAESLYRVVVSAGFLYYAVLIGSGRPGTAAGVLGVILLLGSATAVVVRSGPRQRDVGAGSLMVGLAALGPAVWMGLLAADATATTQVRASLLVTVVLCVVAHGVARGLPQYGPHALVVALAAVTTAPVWAAPGSDPVALHAAAALLLTAALLPLATARGATVPTTGDAARPTAHSTTPTNGDVEPAGGPSAGWAVGRAAVLAAAVIPGLALLGLTFPDIAVVVLEPWTAVADIWSGVAPVQSSVAWSSVVAIALAGAAAAAARLLTFRSVGTNTGNSANRGTGVSTDTGTGAGAGTSTGLGVSAGTGMDTDAGTGVGAGTAAIPGVGSGTGGGIGGTEGRLATGVLASGPLHLSAPGLVARILAPLAALLVPLVLAAASVPWPAVPLAGLVCGLFGLTVVAVRPARRVSGNLTAGLCGVLAAAGVAGSLAGHVASIVAFALVVVASAAVGAAGSGVVLRIAGWTAGSIGLVVLAYTIGDALDLGAAAVLAVLVAGALIVALEWVLRGWRPGEAAAPFAVAHAAALIALLTTDSAGWAAQVCRLWALVLVVRAFRPGESRTVRARYGLAASSVTLLSWWLLLWSRDVELTEAYTLPTALLALGAGWLARRGRPELPSWTAYGPALAAAFLPTLAVVAGSDAGDPQYLRRLLLGAGALAVLLPGSRARLQAPVVTGGGVLVLVALHELVQVWDLVPRWVPLAVGGLLLVGIATTIEQRRRDLSRLRNAITRME